MSSVRRHIPAIGSVHGQLTILEDLGYKPRGSSASLMPMVLCKCKCGNTKEINYYDIRKGRIVSCGCKKRNSTIERNYIHGLSKHPLRAVLATMKDRCHNPNCHDYELYGGRGVILCDAWRSDFKRFYDWAIQNGWEKGLQIDRIDNDAGYSPENCRFVSCKVNNMNRRSSKIWVVDGVEYQSAHIAAEALNVGWWVIQKWCDGNPPRQGCSSRLKYPREVAA